MKDGYLLGDEIKRLRCEIYALRQENERLRNAPEIDVGALKDDQIYHLRIGNDNLRYEIKFLKQEDKRFQAAMKAMGALIIASSASGAGFSRQQIADMSTDYADALLKRLEEG